MKDKHIGFTLVELMVSLAIVAIVAGLAKVSMGYASKTSIRSQAQTLLQRVATDQAAYRLQNNKYDKNYGLEGPDAGKFTLDLSATTDVTLDVTLDLIDVNLDEVCPRFKLTVIDGTLLIQGFKPSGSGYVKNDACI